MKNLLFLILASLALVSVNVQAKPDKNKGLPPGLQKKAAKGKTLPPGWQKKLAVGYRMDKAVYDHDASDVYPLLAQIDFPFGLTA